MARYIGHLAAWMLLLGSLPGPAAAATAPAPVAPVAPRLEADAPTGWLSKRKRRGKKRRQRRRDAPAPSAAPGPEKNPSGPPAPPPLLELESGRAVALLPVQAIEIPEELSRSIEEDLLVEIDEARALVAVSPEDVRREVEVLEGHGYPAPFQSGSCEGAAGCLARAGRYARAHLAIDTRVAGVGGTVKIAMRLFDTVEGREVNRVADVLSETDAQERARQLHRLAVQLLQPETYVGSLSLECDEPGAEIYLNDELVGTTPLEGRIQNLPAGPYILKVSKDGFRDLYQFVDVAYRSVTTYEVSLNENTIATTLVEQESDRGFGGLYVYSESGEFELRIDGDPRGTVPLRGGPIGEVAAGERRVSLRTPGGAALVQPISVEAGRRTDLVVEDTPEGYRITRVEIVDAGSPLPQERLAAARLRASTQPQARETDPRGLGWRFTTGLVLGGLGAAGLGAGAYFSREVARIDERARALESAGPYPPGSQELQRAAELNADGDAAVANQSLSYLAGGTLIAAGAAFVIWDLARVAGSEDPPPPTGEPGVTFQLAPLSGGACAGLIWRF